MRRRQKRGSESEKGSVAGEGRYDDVGGDGARVVAKQLERESTEFRRPRKAEKTRRVTGNAEGSRGAVSSLDRQGTAARD